jgi:hypothetical protein
MSRMQFNARFLLVLLCSAIWVCGNSSTSAGPRPIQLLGTDASGGFDWVFSSRVLAINPRYARAGAFTDWATIATSPDTNTWDWSGADKTIAWETAHRHRIIHCAFLRPDWQTNDDTFVEDFTTYLRLFYTRYKGKIYACEVWNEPTYLDPVTQHWGALPGVTNDQDSLWMFLPTLYKAARETVKAIDRKVLIVGPDWQGSTWWDSTAGIWKYGAGDYLDVFTYHEYNGSFRHSDGSFTNPVSGFVTPPVDVCVQNHRKAMGNKVKPIWCTEMGLFGQSASSALHPNTGWVSGFSEAEGITDAVNCAKLMRKAGVRVIIPHVMPMATSDPAQNYEIFGYEFDDTGGSGYFVPMKAKTRAFINTLKHR